MSSMAGSAEVVRALSTMRRELVPALAADVRAVTQQARAQARASAPFATGTLQDAIQETYFDDGLTGVVFVAPREDMRRVRGGYLRKGNRRPANFPLWIEYGTVKMRSRPFLGPALHRLAGAFSDRALATVRRLVEGA